MSFGGVMLAMAGVQAVASIGQGYAAKAEAGYNAAVLESQAKLIDTKKEIEYGQYERLKGQAWNKSIANVAAAGIYPTGSAMAVMIDTQTQIIKDQATGQFNLEQNKQFTLSSASAERRKGKMAVETGYTNAFIAGLSGLAQYKLYNAKQTINTDQGAKKAGGQ
jgi:Tfp pilus assembly PilM family ATPase